LVDLRATRYAGGLDSTGARPLLAGLLAMLRYKLRTLMIVLAIAPPLLAAIFWVFIVNRNVGAKRYVIECAILEGRPEGSIETETPRPLARPRMTVSEGREANILIGGESIVGDETVPHGTSLKVNVAPADNAKLRVTGVLELSAIADVSDGVVVRSSTAVHFAKTVACGEQIRLPMPETVGWFEMLIERQ